MAAEQPQDAVRSLMLPLTHDNLLVPGTVVAEVVAYQPAEPGPADAPGWFLGYLPWRGQRVPCVAVDAMEHDHAGQPTGGSRSRFVVLKTVGDSPDLPYLAVYVEGIPRLMNLDADTLELRDDEATAAPPGMQCAVLAQGEPALIPDLPAIEAWVRHSTGR